MMHPSYRPLLMTEGDIVDHLCRVPTQSVSIMYNGAYVQMDRVSDNYFTVNANGGAAFQLPTSLQITSILGDTVYDTLSTSTPSVSLHHSESSRIARKGRIPYYQYTN
jgi:hypothetical protein